MKCIKVGLPLNPGMIFRVSGSISSVTMFYESVASLDVRTGAVECNPVVVESCIQMEGVGWDWIGWGWDVVWCRVGWDGVGWGSCDWLRLVATG